MRSSSWHLVVLSAAVLALASLTFGQSATTSLRGTISDAKGAVVTGATITLNNSATGFSRAVTTAICVHAKLGAALWIRDCCAGLRENSKGVSGGDVMFGGTRIQRTSFAQTG